MRTLVLAAVLAGGLVFGVHAESFTFTSTGSNTSEISTPGPNGSVRIAAFGVSKGVTSYVGGKNMTTENTCASWPSQPGDLFASHGMCTFSDASGTGYIRFGCNPDKDPVQANCVGGLWGTGGAYAGRSGTLAWHAKSAADGKTAEFAGGGQWGD